MPKVCVRIPWRVEYIKNISVNVCNAYHICLFFMNLNWSVCIKPGKWVIMYVYVSGILPLSTIFLFLFWNCSYITLVFFVFHFILCDVSLRYPILITYIHYLVNFYPFKSTWFHLRILAGFVVLDLQFFCVVFCRSLFVLLFFLVWPLCCLSFFDLRILITPLVSSCPFYFGHFVVWPSSIHGIFKRFTTTYIKLQFTSFHHK